MSQMIYKTQTRVTTGERGRPAVFHVVINGVIYKGTPTELVSLAEKNRFCSVNAGEYFGQKGTVKLPEILSGFEGILRRFGRWTDADQKALDAQEALDAQVADQEV